MTGDTTIEPTKIVLVTTEYKGEVEQTWMNMYMRNEATSFTRRDIQLNAVQGIIGLA